MNNLKVPTGTTKKPYLPIELFLRANYKEGRQPTSYFSCCLADIF